MRSIAVTAHWDAESRTWWTDGDDVPGLCCEGHTFEELSDAVFALAPDLLVANGAAREEAPDASYDYFMRHFVNQKP